MVQLNPKLWGRIVLLCPCWDIFWSPHGKLFINHVMFLENVKMQ